MRIEAQARDCSAARLNRQLCLDPMQESVGFTRHESGELRRVLAPTMEQVLQHFGEKGAARPNRVRQRPLSRLRDLGGAAGRTHTGGAEAEGSNTAAPRLAAV